MKHKHILTILAVIALAAACASAFAQAGVGAAAGAAPAGGADRAAAMQKLLASVASAPPAIAISGNFVYVVQGRTLYQFSVDGLKLVAQAQLGPDPRELLRGAAARRGGRGGKRGLPAPDAGNPNPAPGGNAPGGNAPGGNAPAANAPAGNAPAGGDAPTVVAPPADAPK